MMAAKGKPAHLCAAQSAEAGKGILEGTRWFCGRDHVQVVFSTFEFIPAGQQPLVQFLSSLQFLHPPFVSVLLLAVLPKRFS